MIRIILERGSDQGYLSELTKYLFIADSPAQEAAAQTKLYEEVLESTFVLGSWYLRKFISSREELEAMVQTQVDA